MEEFIFSAVLCTTIIAFGAGCVIGGRRYRQRLIAEEERTRKWKTRAYKMAWGIPLDDSGMRETKHVFGPPSYKDYSCK